MKGSKYTIQLNNETVSLADYCPECSGEGKFERDDEEGHFEVPCGDCDGLGFMTTENGAQILALVQDVLVNRRK